MERHGFDNVEAFRGRANLTRCADPALYARVSYRTVLDGWTPALPVG